MRLVSTSAVVASLVFLPSMASARNLYVSTTGSDSASGTAQQPLQTLQRAADLAGPGDTVDVAPGAYAGFFVESVNASAERPLIFHARPGVVINQPGPAPRTLPLNTATDTYVWPKWPHAITIQRSSYVIVEGFEITGMPIAEYDAEGNLLHKGGSGFYGGASRHLTLRHNNSHDNGRWGFFTSFCDDMLVEDNIAAGSKIEHGIYLSNSADRGIIRRNHVFGNVQSGIQINADNTFDDADYRKFAYPDGVSSHNVIEDNVLEDNGSQGAAAINLDGVSDSIVRANILTNNHATGIALAQIDGRTGSQRNLVIDNWISMATDGRWGILFLGCEPDNVDDTGHCESADEPRLPIWNQRPRAFVSGSTGNTIANNVVTSSSVVNGSLYTDHLSLAVDADARRGTVSDGNFLVDRFAINSDTLAYTPIVLDAVAWRTQTGLDVHSIVVPASQ